MSDALQRLAPPIPPQPPMVADAAGDVGWLVLMACLALAALFVWLAPLGRRLWNRRRLRRALATLARNEAALPPNVRAQALATLVRRYGLVPPDDWWTEANAIRFGRPAAPTSKRVDALIAALISTPKTAQGGAS